MTVQDAQNLLYEWFGSNDSFEINKDLRKVIPIMENEEETMAAFRLALEELRGNNLLSSQDYGDKKYYILTKSYESYVQSVELSTFTTKWLSSEINEFCELIEDKTDLCNTSGITDKDIRNLVHIIQFYKQKTTEKEEIISKFHGGGLEQESLMSDIDVIGGQKILDELISKGYDMPEDDKKDADDEDDDEKKKGKKKK